MITPPEPTRALIVEDDPVVARSVARRLLREGYTVSLAGSCRAARVAGAGFQLAILDLDLPDGRGADLAEELLRLGSAHSIVFYTGSLDGEQRRRAQRLGSVIDKAQDLEQLVSSLGPFPSQPPVSHLAPATRQRPSGARLTRVASDDEAASDSAISLGSSRR